MKRRILSIITALALCLSLCPAWAFAAEADPALCKHHPAHTEDCGYTVPAEGQPCGHEHTDECYTLGALPDTDSGDYYEIGADAENLLDCQHVHDSECGYVQADPGASCGYVCHICPIEDLIAALPEQVTEDNADDVRAQLDHILDLYRELDEGEQEEINLSRIYALQGALDAANDPDMIEGEVSVTYQEASWNGSEVTYTGKTENCTSVESSAEAVTWNAGWYVVNSTVTISEPITVTGAVNLILADDCTLDAQKGIVVTTGNSLTIYAQSGGTGTLNATGTADSSKNASAGIGGSTSSFDSGAITIHGGVINATGGSAGSISYGGAGIGGGTLNYGNGGSSGAITIYGGTVTANSGAGDVTGAGIGGGGGLTGGGTGSNIQIYGGTINATGGEGGAGIGGGSSSGSSSDSSYKSGDGAVTISGGTVTAVGGTNAAGIGGGGGYYYSTQYTSGGCTGGAGSVTISGGIVDAKGGAGNSSGNYAGDPIGNGGNTTAAATVNKTTGIVFENGAGTVCGDVTLDGSYTVPGDYTLNIPVGASLSGSGTLSGGSAFTTENLTADMISVPTNLYYDGKDRTEYLTTELSGELDKGITICGQTFTVSGWTLAVSRTDDLHYTATYTNTDNSTTFQKTITLQQSGTTLDGAVKTYNGDTQTTTFTASDTITVKATPTATGEAPANSAMFAASFTGPGAGQMAVFVGDTQVSAPADKGADGTYTMTVSAADVLVAAGGPGTGITLTAKFVGNNNMADAAGTVNVNISAVAKVEKYGSTTYVGNLDDAFKTENDGATITLLKDVTRTPVLDIQITCNLDLGGHTITCTGRTAISIWRNANLTIQGAGEVVSASNTALDVGGNVTLKGGTFTGGGSQSAGVNVNDESGSLSVTENVTIQNTGGGYGLAVSNAQSVQLSGGKYSGTAGAIVITSQSSSLTLGGLLAHSGDTRYAYFDESGTTPFTGVLGNKSLTGTVTVQKCNHTGEGVCGYTPNESDASTHTKTCLACGYTETDDCGFERTADPTADNHTGQCPDCKRDRSGAHSFSDWAGNPVARTCTVCGYEQTAVARVEKDGITTYVGALADAFTEGNSGATVTLLSEVDLGSNYISIRESNTFTLDLNGQTVKASYYDAFDISGGSLTIQDSGTGGKIESSDITIEVTGGTLSIQSGTVSGHTGVQISSGAVNISGGTISGSDTGLKVTGGGNIAISGGTFSGVIAVEIHSNASVTLKDLLAAGYAYHQNDIPVANAAGPGGEVPLDAKPAWLTGTVTVKECNHTGEGVCEYTHATGTTTHQQTCLACGRAAAAEKCSFDETGACPCGSTLAVTLPDNLDLTYTGTAQTPEVTVMVDGTATLAVNTDYSVAYANNINAGNTAKVTVTGTAFNGTVEKTFAIKKAPLTIKASDQTITYGESITEGTDQVTAAALCTGDTLKGITLNASTKNVPGGTITPSAAQIQNSSGADVADNYNITYQPGTLTINPSPVTLIFNDQTIVYGSTPAEATATPASAKIEYSYTTEAGGTPTPGWPANAGTYTVTAKVEATGNYGEASETITLTINPKAVSNPTIELSDNSFVYDGTEKKPTIVVKDGEAVIPASEYTVTYSDNTDVGTATVTITNVEGNYTVSGTATFTITAKPLAGASVSATGPFTYTGSALTPDPIVTLGGQTLVKGTDYTVAYTNNTDAGTATITVTGTGNYSGTASGTFAIAKATLTVDGNGTASGTYGAKLSELTVDGLTAKLGAGTVTGTWKLTGDTVPNVGDSGEYTATFAPDSGAGNYNPLTAKVKLNIAKANYTGMTAASTSGKFGAEKTYDLSNLLPSGYELGTPTKTDTNSIFEGEPTLSGAVLTYKLADVETNKGKTGTINVPVTSSTNYEPFNLTITVTVTDKFVPTLAVNPITVTYTGEAVPSTAIKGSATVDGKAVPGIWSFGSGQALTNVADSGTKTVKFVPTDTANYAEATGTVVVTINKATPTGAPKYTAISASGKTLADAGLTTEGGTFSTAGTVAWALADTTEVTANTAYEWVFTPTDTANYNILTGKITLWPYTTPSNPGGGTYVPSGPGSSTLPVTTTGQGSSAVTTTTATPAASTQGGTATTTINTAMGNEIVKQAVANNSETVVIAPKVTGRVTKTEVSIPASTVGQIGSQTNASLTVSTPVADVTIPNGGLGSLSSAGGTVTVTAEQTGNTVELTVTAGGRAVQSVPGGVTLTVPMGNTTPGTVAVLVHENGTREVVRKSVADNGAVTIPLDGSAKLVIVDNSGYFADVPATSWAADAVAFASAHELFNGTAPGRFSPDQPMSRGMLAVVLHNLESNPAQALTGAFADVDNRQWYAGGVSWAAAQGIIGGYGNGTFGPNDNITREQLAVMLWRYAGSPAATERELHFADAYKASDWAAEALRWAVEKGVLNGKGGGILDPGGEATRAETAQMLKNFLENK